LDKYEKAPGVINEDVVDFNSDKKYDLIVSISTLEHVGWDESPRDPLKILKAVGNLKNLLAPGGRIYGTIPIGYNRVLDQLLKERKIAFAKTFCLRRIHFNEWIEIDRECIETSTFDYLLFFTTGLLVGVIEKS
jgi:SAM-dependent methyltransferase